MCGMQWHTPCDNRVAALRGKRCRVRVIAELRRFGLSRWRDMTRLTMRPLMRYALSVLSFGAVLSMFASFMLPDTCGACEVSGGPSEVLVLSLESVRIDGAPAAQIYAAGSLSIEGVGPRFWLLMAKGDTVISAEFSK